MTRPTKLAVAACAGLSIVLSVIAFAQQPGGARPWERPVPTTPGTPGAPASPPFGTVPGAPPQTPPQTPPQGQGGAAAAPSPVIARIDGRPITQRDYDRVAEPYFERLKAQLGPGFTGDVRASAVHNVLDELIRRELLVIEGHRQGVVVTDADIDRILSNDPFFSTNGAFDPSKLEQFKVSPQSNYRVILPRLREVALAEKMDQKLRAGQTPSPARVREEWSKRNEQVRFQYLPLTTRDVSLDPEANESEQSAYYQAHPDQFEKKARLALKFVRLALPPEGDSLRAAREKSQLANAKTLVESLHHGKSIDSLGAGYGGANETGMFELPAASIPGIGRPKDILDHLERAVNDTTQILGPEVTPGGVVVAVVVQHETKRLPPYSEVHGDVKRRADAEKRRAQLEADKLAYFEHHHLDFKSPRARLTRVVVNPAAFTPRPPSNADLDRWFAQHGSEFAVAGAGAKPVLTDSLRGLVRVRVTDEARDAHAAQSTAKLEAALRQNPRGIASLAKAEGARADTMSVTRDAARDSLFPPTLVDTLLQAEGRPWIGTVQGPRRLGPYDVVWRVDAVDTAFVPSFEAARSRVERAFQEDRRQQDEAAAKLYFAAHRADYKTPPKVVLEYASVPIPPADSVTVPEAELQRFWRAHQQDRFKQEEQVRARHILINTAPNATGEEIQHARARIDSIRAAIVHGADFAELAKKLSQDPGSGAQGGELGWFGRHAMVQEFSDTSFALRLHHVSQPVKTRFGWHLIEAEDKKAAGVKPFAESRPEIVTELSRGRADSLALGRARRLLRSITAVGAIVATKPYGGVQTSTPISATDPVPGVGMVPELSASLDKLLPGVWSPRPYKEANHYVVVKLDRRVPPAAAEFDEVKRQAVDDMKTARKKELIAKKVAEVQAGLKAGESLDSVAIAYGGLKDSGLLTRMGGFVPLLGSEPRVIDKAFAMKPRTTSDTLQVAQGVVWIRPEDRKAVEGASFAKEKDAITSELLAKNIQDWLDRKKATVKIEVLRADLRQAPPPKFRTVTTTIPGGQ